jgi:hypothetical protein
MSLEKAWQDLKRDPTNPYLAQKYADIVKKATNDDSIYIRNGARGNRMKWSRSMEEAREEAALRTLDPKKRTQYIIKNGRVVFSYRHGRQVFPKITDPQRISKPKSTPKKKGRPLYISIDPGERCQTPTFDGFQCKNRKILDSKYCGKHTDAYCFDLSDELPEIYIKKIMDEISNGVPLAEIARIWGLNEDQMTDCFKSWEKYMNSLREQGVDI